MLAVLESIELLSTQSLDPRCELKVQEIGCGKNDFGEAMRIGRMYIIALDDVVVHQPVDYVGGLPFGGADHRGMPHQIAHVDERHHTNALVFAQILERVVGI
jgi:hypothetical protein